MLFGDELQTQLNHIRASNKISSTANNSTFSNKRQFAKPQTSSKQWRPFLGKTPSRQSVTDLQETSSIQQLEKAVNRPNERQEITCDIMQKLNTIQVSELEGILPSRLEYFRCKAQMFTAVSIAAYSQIWQDLTSDPEVLETVTGQKIEFDTWLKQLKPLMQPKLSDIQSVSIDLEIAQLLQKGVIQPCYHEAREFISPAFTRPKKDGSCQIIVF